MKETYAVKPADVEVYRYGTGTDIIMRKNIQQVEKDDGESWECDERQMRSSSAVSEADVRNDLAWYWAVAGGEPVLAEVKAEKLSELSAACHDAIVAGCDVTLSDGEQHHFALTVEDQLNISTLYGLVAGGATQVPYHADGELCTYFSAADFALIAQAATAHKTYHESYYNSLKSYVASIDTTDGVQAIVYGVEIPEQYQSDVLKALLQTEE